MHERQDDREFAVEEKGQRLMDDMQVQQQRVDDAIAAECRDPGDRPDDIRGQEGHRAQQEQRHLP